MKKLLITLLIPILGFGQQNPATSQGVFDINGVKTSVGPAAFMWDLSDAKYEVPEGFGKHSIFAHEYWMGGVDDGGQLRVAAMTYRQSGNDFWAGPVSDSAYHNPANMNGWDRVWKINKTEIDSHVLYYNNSSYLIPEAIENWPAHGDTLLGQAYNLAPFIDTDNNGLYNPFLGDYPEIKGDQALYIIRNDVGNIHTESEAMPLGVEQHIMFYGYECHDNPAIHHSLFVNMKLYNRGQNNINDFYIGTWLDGDLGYYLDDYVGCDVARNLGYTYNGDFEDEGTAGYSEGFCSNNALLTPPAQGLVYLNDTISKFVYYNNDFTATGNPESGFDFYNYLRGVWRDNIPMTYGGDGHGGGNGATTDLSNYMFPDATDPSFPSQSWTEMTAGNVPADRRFIMSVGPTDLDVGDDYTLDYAFVFAWDSLNVNPSNFGSLALLFNYVDDVKAVYQNPSILACNILGCTDSGAINYDPNATLDDGSCCFTGGCTDVTAMNYNPNALCNDGSCSYFGLEITREEGKGNGGIRLEITDQKKYQILTSANHRSFYPAYKPGLGPVEVLVVDSVNILPGKYYLTLDNPIFNGNAIISYGGWTIRDSIGSIVDTSMYSIDLGIKKHIPSLGIYVSVKQQTNAGVNPFCDPGLIYSSLSFDDPTERWLSGVPDRDDPSGFFWGLNWIRSGTYTDQNNSQMSDYSQNDDPNGVFERAVIETISDSLLFGGTSFTGGTWAPYRFASYFSDGPGISNSITNLAKLENLNSVDVVITDDVTKWSRVCVVEAQEDPASSVGGQVKMGLRQSPSIDVFGNPDNSGTMGMGWFPGYAIDLETGERLNLIFSEDSWQGSENGNDMLWNPTSNLIDSLPLYDVQTNTFSGGNYLLGGKHFIYVVRGESWVKGTDDYIINMADCDFSPNYDESAWIYSQLLNDNNGVGKWTVFKNVTWVGAPLLAPGKTLDLSNEATVKLRINKPYKQYETVADDKFFDKNMDLNLGETYVVSYENLPTTWGGKIVTYDGNNYMPGESFVATTTLNFTGSSKARAIEATAINSFNPTYSFYITNNPSLITNTFNVETENDIINVNVYPNPTEDKVNVNFNSNSSQNINLKLVNSFGQILDSENLKKFKGEYFKVISLKKYSKGLYFLQISTDKGVVNKKIIHQ
tara:strand:- start:197 stop:3646 length:3450 start_codon:yes stop_codon:yes gene_type:complete